MEGMRHEGVVARNEHAFEQEHAPLLLHLRRWAGGERINVRVDVSVLCFGGGMKF